MKLDIKLSQIASFIPFIGVFLMVVILYVMVYIGNTFFEYPTARVVVVDKHPLGVDLSQRFVIVADNTCKHTIEVSDKAYNSIEEKDTIEVYKQGSGDWYKFKNIISKK